MASPTRQPLGQSLAIDLHHCERSRIEKVSVVREVMLDAANKSGASIVDAHFHAFSPQGISGVVVITESHFAIHTWPEHAFATVDVFTCGSSVNLQRATVLLKEGFRAELATVTQHLERGVPQPPAPGDGLTVLITVFGARDISEMAARRFLQSINELARAHGEPLFAHTGFALLDEKLCVSGRMSGDRVDVSVMATAPVAPPAMAEAAMTAFRAERFRFHTGG